jgi:16S rRNA (guanine(966)-N(2))-methyltransferase RsmD
VRIIGGQWKRSKLPVQAVEGLRPTPDRVRETLFNWLGQDLTGWVVLDAFAGSGALGLESASRGAAEVLLLESDAAVVRCLRDNLHRLDAATPRVQVLQADSRAWLRRAPQPRFDLIFLDPPYALRWGDELRAAAVAHLRPGGWIYQEDDRPVDADKLAAEGWQVWRSSRAGQVHFQLLRRSDSPASD